MITRLWNILERATHTADEGGLRFQRPLLLLQSDDWGRVGVRDREGWEQLRVGGLELGQSPYDFYSLETSEDVTALGELLKRHHDSVGRNPSIVMNFIMANVDFERALASWGNEISLRPLGDGLPAAWGRPRLFEAYRQGVEEGVFLPALHGLTHFCARAVSREIDSGGERGELLRKLWKAQTPYIYWRMPWIGYEYWDPEMEPEQRFLPLEEQRVTIQRAAEIYRRLFGEAPFSACAPGYRANFDTRAAWFACGIRVAQNGPARIAPHFDEREMLHTFRTVEMEPAIGPIDLKKTLDEVEACFKRGLPAIVSIHSVNFHSSIRDFRGPAISLLDGFLAAVKRKWADVLYVNDADLYHIASEGFYFAQGQKVLVGAAAA
ncbi:MAG TPA: hypothetical protein VMI10_02855 [Terriglobales bacterium]|nr:hypothetical protein [Terriglobales bacterium]